jgi:hypothetical protein
MPSPTILLSDLVQGAAPASGAETAAPAGAPASAPAQAPQQSPFSSFLMPLLLCAVVFYFLVLGPERKQRKKRDEMLKKLGKGDKVMTTGGLTRPSSPSRTTSSRSRSPRACARGSRAPRCRP